MKKIHFQLLYYGILGLFFVAVLYLTYHPMIIAEPMARAFTMHPRPGQNAGPTLSKEAEARERLRRERFEKEHAIPQGPH